MIQGSPCPACKHEQPASIALKINQKSLFFDFSKLSLWEITKRRAELKLDFVINFILYIVATLGILFLAFYGYKQFTSQEVQLPLGLLRADFWEITNIYIRLFLISFLLDLYLIYRMARREELEKYVIKKEYERQPKTTETQPKSIDITQAFSNQALNVLEEVYLTA